MMRRTAGPFPRRCGVEWLLLLGLWAGLPQTAAGEASLARQLRDSVPRVWQLMQANSTELVGRVDVVETTPSEGDVRYAYDFAFGENRALVRCRRERPGGTVEQVACRNPVYAFRLERSGEGPWRLSDFGPGNAVPEAVTRLLEEARPWSQAWFWFDQRTLLDWTRTPGFQVHRVELVDFEKWEGVVRVDFTCPAPEDEGGPPRSGYWILDDGAYWALRYGEWRAAGDAAPRHRESVRLEPNLGAWWPVLSEGERSGRNARGEPWSQRYTYRTFRYDEPPPECAFTLAAFGLSEPGATARPWRGLPCLLAFAGVALAVWLVRLARSR